MPAKKFRTQVTNLSDNDLALLDVMFDGGVVPPMLRQCNIGPQFNVEPHSLDDESLKKTLRRLLKDNIIKPLDSWHRGYRYIAITEHGASLWSSERTPIWERYCSSRLCRQVRDKSILSVRAVSPKVRDDYLRINFEHVVRTKTTTIQDNGLIPWKSFDHLHVGLVAFHESDDFSMDNYEIWLQDRLRHATLVEQERTWWQTVNELQKFTDLADNA